jgi:SAM-dependent methyltransferase
MAELPVADNHLSAFPQQAGFFSLSPYAKINTMSDSITFYTDNAEDFYKRTVNINLENLYNEFLPLIPTGGSILDAGCGSGRDSLYFISKGYQVHAIDAAPELAERASGLIGQTVEVTTFENFRSARRFNGIWACASLLHVSPHLLPAAIEHLASVLQSGGIFYMSFKYGRGQRTRGPRQFTDMDEAGLEDLASRISDLTLKKTWTTEDLRPDRSSEKWMNAIWVKQTTS